MFVDRQKELRSYFVPLMIVIVAESVSLAIVCGLYEAVMWGLADKYGWIERRGVVTDRYNGRTRATRVWLTVEYTPAGGETSKIDRSIHKYTGGQASDLYEGYRVGDVVPVYISRVAPSFVQLKTHVYWYHDSVFWRWINTLFMIPFLLLSIAIPYGCWKFYLFARYEDNVDEN